MHHRTARTALLAATALLGGLLTVTPAGAAPPPLCTATVQDLKVTMSPSGTAQTRAEWEVSCRRSSRITVRLRVCSPERYEAPVRTTHANRYAGSTGTVRPVDREEPMHSAVLDIRANGKPVGKRVRACATEPNGKHSCYPADRFEYPDAGLCGG
jgi:hypothetical protein